MNATYYAYDFKNPQRVICPIKLNVEKHTWIEVSNDIGLHYHESLF